MTKNEIIESATEIFITYQAGHWSNADLNTVEAAALKMLETVKAERKRRATPKAPAAPLPVTVLVADNMRAVIDSSKSRQVARINMVDLAARYKLTVPGLRTLAAHWGVRVSSRATRATTVHEIVEFLVGHRLDSAAIAKVK